MTFWPHYCPVDRCITETADGEECSWCGERQQQIECDDPDPSEPEAVEPLFSAYVARERRKA